MCICYINYSHTIVQIFVFSGSALIKKIFGANTKFEYNHTDSMKSFVQNKGINNVFKDLCVYPKTREKDLSVHMISVLRSLKIIELYINQKKINIC